MLQRALSRRGRVFTHAVNSSSRPCRSRSATSSFHTRSQTYESSSSSSSFGGASAKSHHQPHSSSRAASASTFFFEAHAACKSKRCSIRKGLSTNPDTCGEDSFFLSQNVIGVADGVGGWNDNNVDPGKISRSLMRNAAKFVNDMESASHTNAISTQEVLGVAYKHVLEDDEVEAGSTTACILQMLTSPQGKPLLRFSNLGDSGFVVIRDGRIIFRSKYQYYGRAPYQLAKIPPRFQCVGAIENHPEDADSGELELEVGDLIVIATDGVWDNFMPNLGTAPAFFPPVISWRYAWHGRIASLLEVLGFEDDKLPGLKAQATEIVRTCVKHNLKPDDITVIVARVEKR